MLCSNCGKNEASVRYTRIINGEKTEYRLCEECAKKLGIEDIDFNMPINFSNFLSDFFEDDALLPSFAKSGLTKCPKCGLTYDEFAQNGKFGCEECYDAFSNKIDAVLKNLHGSAKHRGRAPKRIADKSSHNVKDKDLVDSDKMKIDKKQEQINKLNKDLQLAIKEERYEDAAKFRDEIKKVQYSKNENE